MKNVKSGESVRLTAQDVNAWGKVAEAYRSGKLKVLDSSFSESPSPVVITIQNKTGEFAGLFSVLALGESINLVGTDIMKAMPDGINKDVAFEGQKPAGDGVETVCITLGTANPDMLVSAVIIGAVGCVVDVTETSHRYAVPIGDDMTKLESSESGIIKILNPLTETGEQFCYVLLGGGGVAGESTTPGKVRLVQPKELFPACEYKGSKGHFIICPGGLGESKQVIPFIYAFDLVTEKWTATTFPRMRVPMYNMDAAIVELQDGTRNLVILSGQTDEGKFSSVFQGYNFEKDQVLDSGGTPADGGMSFAGRPILTNIFPVRNSSDSASAPPSNGFIQSLLVIGGAERSAQVTTGATGTIAFSNVYFQLDAENLAMKEAYRIGYMGAAYTGSQLHFGHAVDLARSYGGAAGTLVNEIRDMMPFTRHQRLPARAVVRQRPLDLITQATTAAYSDRPKVDILLLGGFNTNYVSPEQTELLNRSVVSGIFQSSISTLTGQPLSTKNRQSHNFANASGFLYYPPTDYVLGDCCVEYIAEWDEVRCFGGRASELSTEPHANIAALAFNQGDDNAQWHYDVLPYMPHPRYSAASVLIRGLVREYKDEDWNEEIEEWEEYKGMDEPCARIFIIGGRNQDGLVPEIDVFNLLYSEWETEDNGYKPWPGLDSGELETIPASLGGEGGGTIINIGNCDCKAIDMAAINQILAQTGFPT